MKVISCSGQDSGASELEFSLGAALAILAVPGAFISILLFTKYSSLLLRVLLLRRFDVYAASLPEKYFFIVFSIVITGLVTVAKWDRMLPSRQDSANLGALPIRPGTIYSANLAAIAALVLVFAIDVNAAATIIYPLGPVCSQVHVSVGEYVRFCGVHALCVVAASIFTFMTCFALMNVLMSILPIRAFRRASCWVRLITVVALFALLCSVFSVPHLVSTLPSHPNSIIRFLPSVWFVALYQTMQGKAAPELAALAWVGTKALGIALTLTLVMPAISYRRYYLSIAESSDAPRGESVWRFGALLEHFQRVALRTAFQRAFYRFAMKTLRRSEPHMLLFGAFAAFGLIFAAQMVSGAGFSAGFPTAELLAPPLCVAYCVIVGLRLAFDLPAELPACWVFRSALSPKTQESTAVARKVMLTFIVPGVILPSVVVYGFLWGWPIGVAHAVVTLAVSLVLIEVVLLNYRKAPFMCPLPPFQNNAIAVALLYVVAFCMFAHTFPAVELWASSKKARGALAAILVGIAWLVIRRLREAAHGPDSRLLWDCGSAVDEPPSILSGYYG